MCVCVRARGRASVGESSHFSIVVWFQPSAVVWDFRSSVMFSRVHLKSVTDVSEQNIDPILTFEGETDRLSQNVGN
jgi:hypothetical protein